MAKERYQNPAVGDEVQLRLFSYNSNNLADFQSVEKVDIYHLDPNNRTAENPDGLRLVETFDGAAVTAVEVGHYLLNVELRELVYGIGTYSDVWTVRATATEPANEVRHFFQIYPSLWYTTPIPVVYDFKFMFQPTKFRQGSKQYIIVEIIPNVPTAGDLRSYYENLAIVSNLSISMEQRCGNCLPAERDLRLILENEPVQFREKRHGYYQLDTTDLASGIYDVWFQLEFGGNRYISDRQQLQIYE